MSYSPIHLGFFVCSHQAIDLQCESAYQYLPKVEIRDKPEKSKIERECYVLLNGAICTHPDYSPHFLNKSFRVTLRISLKY
jgi:hypothetical protein